MTVDDIVEMEIAVYEDRFETLVDLGYEQGDAVAIATRQVYEMNLLELIEEFDNL